MRKEIQHLPSHKGFEIDVLRLDLIHPFYGGNKYFKLKYNIINEGSNPILTFGGAHSNHIYATAAYCHEQKIKCIGVIRGEETMIANSPTLRFAQSQGMHLHFIAREKYKNKTDDDFVEELEREFGSFYIIPEGGNNDEGIRGCKEILDDIPFYDYVFCACGTACTYSGILSAAKSNQIIIGISVLKGENELMKEVNIHASKFNFSKIKAYNNGLLNYSTILNNYHFGGYAKHNPELLLFKSNFEKQTNMPLDYVYTTKLFYAVYNLLNQNLLESNKKILIIHSGGQQGNHAYEQRYQIIQ